MEGPLGNLVVPRSSQEPSLGRDWGKKDGTRGRALALANSSKEPPCVHHGGSGSGAEAYRGRVRIPAKTEGGNGISLSVLLGSSRSPALTAR